jgi:hypothetical protein
MIHRSRCRWPRAGRLSKQCGARPSSTGRGVTGSLEGLIGLYRDHKVDLEMDLVLGGHEKTTPVAWRLEQLVVSIPDCQEQVELDLPWTSCASSSSLSS